MCKTREWQGTVYKFRFAYVTQYFANCDTRMRRFISSADSLWSLDANVALYEYCVIKQTGELETSSKTQTGKILNISYIY